MKSIIALLCIMYFVGCAVVVDGENESAPNDDGAEVIETPNDCPSFDGLEKDIIISTKFSEDEKQVFLRAIAEWESVGVRFGEVRFEAVDMWREADGGKVWGWYRFSTKTIYVVNGNVRPAIVDLWKLALHEVGHAAGAVHHNNFGIMRGDGMADELPDCITPDDLELFCLDGDGNC